MKTTLAVAIVCMLGAVLSARSAHLRDQATAATAASVVQVTVSVRDGSRPVIGLTAQDFVLTDNEVAQTVTVVSADQVPADITLVVDTKGSTTNLADRFVKDMQQIGRVLRKDDRLRLLRVDTFVEELRPMSPVSGPLTIAPWRQVGWSSLHDAVVAALLRRPDAERPQLVVVVSDGADTMSVTTSDRVREVASRSDTLLQIVTVRTPTGSGGPTASLRPRFRDANVLVLAEAAEQTGGELRGPGLFGDSDLPTAFTRVFDEFRQSYILRYTPTNVDREGWHDLSVTVPRSANAAVRARRGYHAD